MLKNMLQSKIHRAVVTECNLNYEGSISIDEELCNAAGMLEHQKVQVVNLNNGNRFDTYIIIADKGSGTICLNGAAARLAHEGDKVIIIAYVMMDDSEIEGYLPKIVMVDEQNRQVNLNK